MTKQQIKDRYNSIPSFIRDMDEDVLVYEIKNLLEEKTEIKDEIEEWYQHNDEDAKDNEIIDNEIRLSEINETINDLVVVLAYKNEDMLKENFPNLYENLIERS
jgi:hypothetical protein